MNTRTSDETAHQKRMAEASKDIGKHKPLSRGFHAELRSAFHLHDIYEEQRDGGRIHVGTLSVKAVEAWAKETARAAVRRSA